MQIRASKLARKHFYSLLHPTDSNVCLGQDVVILSPRRGRQDPLNFADNLVQARLARKHFYLLLHPEPNREAVVASGSPK